MTRWTELATSDRRRLSAWLAVVSAGLVVAIVVGVLSVPANRVPDDPDRSVSSAAASAVTELMTFAPTDASGRRDDVESRLTGVLAADYALRGPDVVFPSAAESRVTMTVDVTDAATVTQTDRTARVLVFADQTIVVGKREDIPSKAGVSRWAWMTRVGDQWLLAKLEPVTPQ
ncbi:hypothetical protein JVX90_14475 [Gordonia sp. PDNC005]|uniref:hypothetical protein n=1 Tax=unclassified Gordonia (in: high G+C Gram-positive bacteria) TaxID=2657482 RepID=UPI001962D2C2|nr:hypothetical protein [Gordonia sp. PDNC005]QRY61612.1 hypothetical protein JVX90_14475 [Gordonia sp. PDNC005]